VGCFRRVQGKKSHPQDPSVIPHFASSRSCLDRQEIPLETLSYNNTGVEPENIFPEYHYYAGVKARIFDEAFIDQFDENTVLWMARKYNWISSVEPPSPVSISTSP
jgi:hypothetical protein